jgi:hypothetical protein
MVLIMRMGVKAGHIAARAQLQGAAALGMACGGSRPTDETEGSHPGKRSTSGDQEVASRKLKDPFYLSGHPWSPSLKPVRPSMLSKARYRDYPAI